jgi:hypothetical protein
MNEDWDLEDLNFYDSDDFEQHDEPMENYDGPKDFDSILNNHTNNQGSNISYDDEIRTIENEYRGTLDYNLSNYSIDDQFTHHSFNAYKRLVGENKIRAFILKKLLKNNFRGIVYFPVQSYTSKPQFKWGYNFEIYMNKIIKHGTNNRYHYIYTIVSSPSEVGEVTHYLPVTIDIKNETMYVFDPAKGVWEQGEFVKKAVHEYANKNRFKFVSVDPNRWQSSCLDTWCQTWGLYYQYLTLHNIINNLESKSFDIRTFDDDEYTNEMKQSLIKFIKRTANITEITKGIKKEYKSMLMDELRNDKLGYNEGIEILNETLGEENSHDKLYDLQLIYLGDDSQSGLIHYAIGREYIPKLLQLDPIIAIENAEYDDFFPV